MIKTYRYRLNPNKKQIEFFEKCFGCVRYVYNWGLDLRVKTYEQSKINLGWIDICKKLTILKQNEENKWLKEVPVQCLQSSIRNMDRAFIKFFKENRGFPKFKSKKDKQAFHCPQGISINFSKHKVKIPKIGWVNFYKNRDFIGKIGTATISKSSTNKYYISILIDDGIKIPPKNSIDINTSIGIDVGIKDFAVLSNGQVFKNPKYLEKAEQRLKVLQRKYSRKQKGSKRQENARLQLAKAYEKVKNCRINYIHKVTSKIIRENQTVIIENLNINELLKNHINAKYINSISWGEFFRQLQYKTEWSGVNLIQIDRFKPTSKTCLCGFVNNNLQLSDREWDCLNCGRHNDRDLLAAINIKRFGLNNLITPVDNGEEDVEWSVIADTVKRQYITI